MDPVTAVGLAASIIQIEELARTTISALFQYFEDVRHAPKRSRELRRELETVCDLLGDLDLVLTSHSTTSTIQAPDSLKSAITDFRGMLDTMCTRVAEARTKGLKRLKWPFTEHENDRYLARMERYKSTFNAALNITTA
jgi:Fungal N-terminal domain of STAND proteins